MGHVNITRESGETVSLGQEDPAMEPFRRWVEDRARLGAVCSQPGTPGSSTACLSCTASCSSEPADVDPEEPPLDVLNEAVLTRWDHDRTEGR